MPAPSVIWLCGPDAGGTLGYDESGGSCDESLMCLWSSVLGLYGPTLVTSPHPAAAIASGARRSNSAGDATVGPGRRTRTTTTVTAPSSATISPMRRVRLARTIFRCNAARSRRACVWRSAFVTRPPVGSLFAIKCPAGRQEHPSGGTIQDSGCVMAVLRRFAPLPLLGRPSPCCGAADAAGGPPDPVV